MKEMTISDPSNVAQLLFCENPIDDFSSPSFQPYVGPVRVETGSTVTAGRGLVATRDIEAGECLFVIPPVATAPVQVVQQQWKKDYRNNDDECKLERVAEQVLVQEMQRMLSESPTEARSFLTLEGSSSSDVETLGCSDGTLSIQRLLGKDTSDILVDAKIINKEDLLQIVRRNAFGPDFVTFATVEQRWSAQQQQERENVYLPRRLLGMYPLAAMLNHSCIPNAVKVFAGDVMIVHATASIQSGAEIVWPYLPPTMAYPERSERLQTEYGFSCQCERCRCEQTAWEDGANRTILEQTHEIMKASLSADATDAGTLEQLQAAVDKLEGELLASSTLSNELKRYLRVGYTNIYVQYFNAALENRPSTLAEANAQREKLLQIAMQLHFSFCACDNACTEHLSILHLAYELISVLHSSAVDKSKTLPKVRFWTEQLKRAHMTRYGRLGNDLETVRRIMQHTKTVLRNRNGMEVASFSFI